MAVFNCCLRSLGLSHVTFPDLGEGCGLCMLRRRLVIGLVLERLDDLWKFDSRETGQVSTHIITSLDS